MPRDHALAMKIKDELAELREKIAQLEEDLLHADPEVAQGDKLEQQTMTIGDIEYLAKVDDGRLAKEYNKAVNRLVTDVGSNPFRMVNSKPKAETRKLAIIMELTPIVIAEDASDGRSVKTNLTMDQCEIKFRTVLKLPDLQGASSKAYIKKNADGSIRDMRVNPENPDSPTQLNLFDSPSE
ncbi:MAG: hypothetical protein E6R03_12325 [Hyphomicrobiaceae bacterium]|nr:MAG: hypothetical protein E6R03_12325 [Hyphomicrobiaceae bacterium]